VGSVINNDPRANQQIKVAFSNPLLLLTGFVLAARVPTIRVIVPDENVFPT
jgi:hypothetical protein